MNDQTDFDKVGGGGIEQGLTEKKAIPKRKRLLSFFGILIGAGVFVAVIYFGATAKQEDANSRSLCSHPVELVLHEGSNTTNEDREQISLKYFSEGGCADLPSLYCTSDLGAYDTYACSALTKEQEVPICNLLKGKGISPLPPFCQ